MAAESVEIVLNGVDNATPVMDKVTQKLVDNENKYISKLKEQLIALEQGAEAAERFKLSEMGFAEETINSAMAIKQQIEALKQAGQQIEQTGVEMQKTGSSFKDTSEASQKVSSTFSKAFGALGLSELAAFTSEIGGLSGQLKEMEEAGKKGGDAFKGLAVAGMAIAAVTASWKIGTLIADWVYQTEELNRRMKETLELMSQQASFANDKTSKQFQMQMDLANAALTEEQRLSELAAVRAAKNKEFKEAEQQLIKEERDLQSALANDVLGYGTEDNAAAEEAVKIAKDRLKLLKEQKDEVEKAIRGPSENEQELTARQKAKELQKEAADEALAAEQRQFQEWSKNWDDQKKAQEDLRKKEDDYLAALQIRNEELMNGKRAADEMKASMAGISEEVILQGRELSIQNELLEAQKQLADEQKKKDEERQKAFAQPSAPLQAMQSRLLSRVSTGGGDRVAKATEKTAELTAEIERLQREQLDLQKRRGVTELAIVEG
jgi:hypothetical protein